MSRDISQILQDWDYEPEEIRVRIVQGDDGREVIQMRVELGVLQMEMDGRPDGTRPENCESWLDYYEKQQRIHQTLHRDAVAYLLEEQDCTRLWREGVQYYHRYLSFWHLEKYDLCARDTARNLRLFAFVHAHAAQDRHKLQFDQWRPYVTMMHTRAEAMPLVKEGRHAEALRVIEAGIQAIGDFLDEYRQNNRAEQCAELVNLQQWRREVLALQARAAPPQEESPIQLLRRKLQKAVAQEEFEEAARLRDEIRRLREHGPAKH